MCSYTLVAYHLCLQWMVICKIQRISFPTCKEQQYVFCTNKGRAMNDKILLPPTILEFSFCYMWGASHMDCGGLANMDWNSGGIDAHKKMQSTVSPNDIGLFDARFIGIWMHTH